MLLIVDIFNNDVFVSSGWLSACDDPLGYVSRIDQRIEDTTGLDMTTAEQLQVNK